MSTIKKRLISLRTLSLYIVPEKRNEFIAGLIELDSWQYGFPAELMQDILLESDIDLLIGTKNIYILHDRINDQLYSVRTCPVGNGDSPIDYRLDFNTITYLG